MIPLVPVITALSPILGDLIDRAFPNSAAREQAKLEYMAKIQEQLTSLDIAQVQTNQAEAASGNMFVAGWRAMCGWICALAFAYHFILQPMIVFGFTIAGHPLPVLPVFDMEVLNTVLMGMLGLGSLRTFEKLKGVERNELPWRKGKSDEEK